MVEERVISYIAGTLEEVVKRGHLDPDSSPDDFRKAYSDFLGEAISPEFSTLYGAVNPSLDVVLFVLDKFFLKPLGDDFFSENKEKLIDGIRAAYQPSAALDSIAKAFTAVPRERFLLWPLRELAYRDKPYYVGHDQTISQPTVIVDMMLLSGAKAGSRVLEIGTGPGYQATLLSHIVKGGHVYTMEIVPQLAAIARRRVKEFGLENVTIIDGDGSLGYSAGAPYDVIIVTANVHHKSPALGIWRSQLTNQGTLVVPVGGIAKASKEACAMFAYGKKDDNISFLNERCVAAPASSPLTIPPRVYQFVPLTGAHGTMEVTARQAGS